MKDTRKSLQQGDVLFNPITNTDGFDMTKAKKVERGARGFVIKDGETTGHAHCADVTETDFELYQIGDEMLANVINGPVEIGHEEHKTQTLDNGWWEVNGVIEKDWLANMVREVRD